MILWALILAGGIVFAAQEGTVASVNGVPIMLSEFRGENASELDYWAHVQPQTLRDPAFAAGLKEKTLTELIERELLNQQAEKEKIRVKDREVEAGIAVVKERFSKDENGVEVSEEQAEENFQRHMKTEGLTPELFRKRITRELMARKLLDEKIGARLEPPPAKEVEAYLDLVKRFVSGASTEPPKGMDAEAASDFLKIGAQVRHGSAERVRIANILVRVSSSAGETAVKKALAGAEAIRAEVLARGTSSFAEIARAESEDADNAANGGDIGEVARGEAPPTLEKEVFALPLGGVSAPVRTDAGFRVFLVKQKTIAEAPDYQDLKAKLAKILTQMAAKRRSRDYIEELKKKAEIKTYPELL